MNESAIKNLILLGWIKNHVKQNISCLHLTIDIQQKSPNAILLGNFGYSTRKAAYLKLQN